MVVSTKISVSMCFSFEWNRTVVGEPCLCKLARVARMNLPPSKESTTVEDVEDGDDVWMLTSFGSLSYSIKVCVGRYYLVSQVGSRVLCSRMMNARENVNEMASSKEIFRRK